MTDSYIVRIHRRIDKPDKHQDMVGVVEDPLAGNQQAFHNALELWAILENSRQTKPRKESIHSR